MFQDYINLLNNTVLADCLNEARSKKYLYELLEPELLLNLTMDLNLQCSTCLQVLPKPYFQELSANFIVETIMLHPDDIIPAEALKIFNARYFVQNEKIVSELINTTENYYLVIGSHVNSLLFEQIRTDLNIHAKIDIFLFENKSSQAYKKIPIGLKLTCGCEKNSTEYYLENLNLISEIFYNELPLNFAVTDMSDSEILNIKIEQYSKNKIKGINFNKQPEIRLLDLVELQKGFNFLTGDITQSFLDSLNVQSTNSKISLAKFLNYETKLAKAFASTINAKVLGLKPNDFIRTSSSLYCDNCSGRKCEECDYSGLSYLAEEFKILNISYKEFIQRKIKDNLGVLRILGLNLENEETPKTLFELPADFFNYHNQINRLWIEYVSSDKAAIGFEATDINELALWQEYFKDKIVIILNTNSFNLAAENCIYVKRELDLGYKFYKYEKK